jgi:RNase P/RNase MRP subunit p29
MRKGRIFWGILVFWGMVALAASSAQAADLSGTWLGKTEVPETGTDEVTLVLTKTKTGYTGTVTDALGVLNKDTEIKGVKLEGDELTFSFLIADGTTEIVIYLTVSGEKLIGRWENPNEDGASAPIEFIKKD